ncbi:MAG: T9SS type A sorting domain-containing protein [Bacteroidales bacterium]|nr:T9SS type A sorting domain-containing protein [Bacteroidales bacterium]
MKKTLLFFAAAVITLNLWSQPLKKVDLPKSHRQKATVHVLDSTLWSIFTMGNYMVYQKEIITSRVSGAEYLWNEKLKYLYDNNNQVMRLIDKTKQTYLNNSVNAPVHTILKFPWNTTTNAWDDTLYFVKLTGDTNHILDFVIITDYVDKTYDYIENKFIDGVRYKLYLLNDTCPSMQEMFLYDTITNTFNPYQKVLVKYDSNLLVDSVIVYYFNDVSQQYELSSLMLYTFSNNLISQIIYKVWDGIQWQNSQKESYSYDSQGNELLYLNQYWDYGLNDWKNSYKTEKNYYSNYLLQSDAQYMWDDIQNIWKPVFKTEYAYDANGNNTYLEYFMADTANFIPSQKFEKTYDSNNLLQTSILSSWDINTSTYFYNYKEEYYYTNNRNDSIYYYMYDNALNVWYLAGKNEKEYDSYNELIRYENFSYNSGWEPSSKTEYFYSDINLKVNSLLANNFINVYPNPSSRYININFNKLSEINELIIYDANGKLLKRFNKISLLSPIDVSTLAEGTYIIQINTKDKIYQSKFVKK